MSAKRCRTDQPSDGYAVFDNYKVDGTYHVYPLFGPDHYCTSMCWCHPEPDVDGPIVIIHNVAH